MSIVAKLRNGDGPFWGGLKHSIKLALTFHLPVNALTKPLFRLLYLLHVFFRESWIWACRFFWYEPLFRSQCESIGSRFQMEGLPYLTGQGRIIFGEGVRLSGKSSIAFGRESSHGLPELVVGDNTFIGHNCSFNVGISIRIGSNCLIASAVAIFDQDGHPTDAMRRRSGEPTPPDTIVPVFIGDDVWIGNGSLILKGISIGDRSIIAARSIVTKSVPPDTLVAGNPARIVRSLISSEKEQSIS